jgi:hypothetical protein
MKRIFLAAALVWLMSPLAAFAATPCTLDGTGAINTAVTVNCGTTPQGYEIIVYQLGLCTANPSTGATPDFSSCQMMLNGPGQTASLAAGSSIALGNLSAPPFGTYPFAVLVAGNSIGITSTQRYSVAMTGSAGGAGTTCWSVAGTVDRGNPTPTMVACGAVASPAKTIDKLTSFSHANNANGDPSMGGAWNGTAYCSGVASCTVEGGTIAAKLATSSLTAAVAGDWPNGITRIIAVQTFTTPIVIDGGTTGLDVGFNISNASSPWITGGAGGTIQQFGSGPFSMVISAKR